jgi:Fe2+ transport system protein FeoA
MWRSRRKSARRKLTAASWRERPDYRARFLDIRKPRPRISIVTLDDLVPGERATVRSFVQSDSAALPEERSALQRLSEMGLVPGARLRLVRRAPFGDPLEIEIGRFHLALRRTEARRIEVELEEPSAS